MELENVKMQRSTKGDVIASACNTDFESHNTSSNTARTIRDDSGQKCQRSLPVLCDGKKDTEGVLQKRFEKPKIVLLALNQQQRIA